MSQTTKVPTQSCPECGHVVNRATSFERQAQPTPGDVSLCIRCGVVMIFGDDLEQRRASPAELAALPLELQRRIVKHKKLIAAAAHVSSVARVCPVCGGPAFVWRCVACILAGRMPS